MATPPDDFDPPPGVAEHLGDGVRRILAPNPSPMTYRGTNTYLVGNTDLAVIDPGPAIPAHMDAILAAVSPGQRITHILVTHAHVDHSPLARPLSVATGAPVLAFGDAAAGRSPVMAQLAAAGLVGGGEGVDGAFVPDRTLGDGDRIAGPDWSLEVIHTPGHMGNHIALALGDICFTGDHVMGWASSLVSPPDGDLTDFMASCTRLAGRTWRVFHPGHGAPVDHPGARLDWLIAHRRAREAEILARLEDGPASVDALTAAIYHDTPASLLPAAARNVFAHLVDLVGRDLVAPKETLSVAAIFALTRTRR